MLRGVWMALRAVARPAVVEDGDGADATLLGLLDGDLHRVWPDVDAYSRGGRVKSCGTQPPCYYLLEYSL